MPLTPDEFDLCCRMTCRHCERGNIPRWLEHTKEYQHDIIADRGASKSHHHTFCLATGLRRAYEEGRLNG